QVIRGIEGISREGIAGTLTGTSELGWGDTNWQIDPGLLDGALQLAVLWACHVLGGATLPMAVKCTRIHLPGLAPGPVRCVVAGRGIFPARGVSDVTLIDRDGRLLGGVLGVETVLRPNEASFGGTAHAV